jgi:hypothetical protein
MSGVVNFGVLYTFVEGGTDQFNSSEHGRVLGAGQTPLSHRPKILAEDLRGLALQTVT